MGWGKDEKFECYVGSLKNPIFRGEGHKKTIYRVGGGGGCIPLVKIFHFVELLSVICLYFPGALQFSN